MKRFERVDATTYDNDGAEVRVTGTFWKGLKGSRDAWGARMEPDDEDTIEVEQAFDEHGEELELTDELRERAEEALWDSVCYYG